MTGKNQILSPQTITIYRFLLEHQSATAKDIGKKLRIFPHAVYRSIIPLIQLGIVTRSEAYPAKFEMKSPAQAMESYLFTARSNFLETFFSNGKIHAKAVAKTLNQ